MKPVNLGLLGVGTVGASCARALRSNQAEIAGRAGREIQIVQASRRDPARGLADGLDFPLVGDPFEVVENPEVDVVVELIGGERHLVASFCDKLEQAGISIEDTPNGLKVSQKNARARAVDVTTEPYPGFPTDLQAQFMALMCTAEGVAHLHEKIFENRFMHAPELLRMGANIEVNGGTAVVTGVERLKGAPVMATDLRASVSLILAGLAAEGDTTVARVYHLDRGYEQLEQKLSGVGAKVERIST